MLARSTLIALTVALLATLGWLALEGSAPPDGAPPPGTPTLSEGPDHGAEEPPALAIGAVRDASRSVVELEVSEAPRSTAERDRFLTGVVLSDASGTPLPGARVTVTRRTHTEFRIPDMNEREAREAIAEVVTDAAGRFELAVPSAVPLDLQARAPRHATAVRSHVFAGEDVQLRLTAAAILEGTLTRTTDGSPVENALVLGRDSRRVEVCRARTGLAGEFLFEDLSPGLLDVQITPEDATVPPSQTVELQAGIRSRIDLVLDSGVRVHGIVADVDGHPIAGAEVGLGGSFKRSVVTDIEGEYELLGVGGVRRRDLTDLRARAVGYGGERAKLPLPTLTSATRVDFVLRTGRIAAGRVVDPDGAPLEGVYVAGSGTKKAEGVSRTDWDSTLTGADGRFELTSLHPLVDHQLFLKKDGHGTRVYDFPRDEGDRERVELGDLVLHPGGRIEGTLTNAAGQAIPDHLVKLRGTNGDVGRLRPEDEGIPNTWVTTVRASRTDTRGRFHFADLPGG
ncbi:MAG: carboxypeptidase-like regulatory domain-containing protein, partial [Planctomycetota bacterium]|nr:carboxypeptidase-like regulatory domain-containing protein [Planctomycetota bacterium]